MELLRRTGNRPVTSKRKLAQHFELEDILGRGGLGRLFRARRVDSGELVALRLTGIPAVAEVVHALTEVIALHERIGPPLARVFDCGEEDGDLWYAMEYLEGESFETLIRRGGVRPPDEAVHLLLQAAASVVPVHQAGLLHRDIKPGNLFLHGSSVRLLELGINEALARAAHLRPGILSTPSFRAPEEWTSIQADERVDVYALGGLLYFLLTGRKAFPDGQRGLVLATRLNVKPPNMKDVPRRLRAVIERALAMQPEDRFASVQELASVVEKAVHGGR